MPLFEYLCLKCKNKFTLLVGMTAEKAKLECPGCGSKKLQKLISRIARTPKSANDFDDDAPGDDFGGDMGDDFDDDLE
jgi:putative FmdB family regulatory protein